MTATTSHGSRVLIVEDEAITALDLSTELAGLGYAVCGVVDTSEAAIGAAERERPALVLMDVRLADGGDGIETARRICSRHDTAIVFLTAHSDEATLARALAVSPFGYLIKPFRARDLKVAIDLAIAKHTKDAEAARHLQTLAATDALTGLPNRRQLDATLQAEWLHARDAGRPLSVVMADIDHFKAFNDACGHLAGDACIGRVADILRTACGVAGSVLGRWGGEEFLAILPGTDRDGAAALAERLVAAVREAGVPHPTAPSAAVVTISAGAASMQPTSSRPVEAVLERADSSLYAAKRGGRSRAVAAPADDVTPS